MVLKYKSSQNFSPNYEKIRLLYTKEKRTIGKYRTIERYVISTFVNNFISLIDKWYQNTSLLQISAQAMEKYGHYKQNNREQ